MQTVGYSLNQLTQLVFFLKHVKDKEGEKERAEERRREEGGLAEGKDSISLSMEWGV